jgi:hypothetical protein
MTTALLAAALGAGLPASAQVPQGSTATAVNPVYGSSLGDPLSVTGGPWVPAEVLFFSKGRIVADYAWRDRVRARRGVLYAAPDLAGDVQTLMGLDRFDRVSPAVYAISGQPVPPEYATISVSTNMVRVVFEVVEKAAPAAAPAPSKLVPPPTAVGGVILTPTAWRGAGRHTGPGMALDVNAAYIIGRLYGKNNYPDAPRKTNYIDRVGLWTLTADGKMQIQSESDLRPAMAVGGQGMLIFRDSPQPTVTTPGVSVKVDAKNTKLVSAGYFVASKKLGPMRTSAGVLQGNLGDLPAMMTENLTGEALKFYARDNAGPVVKSRTIPFLSTFYLVKPDYPVGLEIMKFNGAHRKPMLINFKVGRLFRLNFDLALLRYQGGYDLLGLFQFRYNHFPKN